MPTRGTTASRSIIIVGTSPNLLENDNGDAIDRFDIVVRVGQVVIDNYEKHVGTRTDINITRTEKYKRTPNDVKSLIKDVVIFDDITITLGRCSIDFCLNKFPDSQIYLTGFTLNLATHLHNDTKYTGKYYDLSAKQWNLPHDLIGDDIYINRLIATDKIKVLA